MSDYRRYFVAGGTYFFTLVTDRRARLIASPVLANLRAIDSHVLCRMQDNRPFK